MAANTPLAPFPFVFFEAVMLLVAFDFPLVLGLVAVVVTQALEAEGVDFLDAAFFPFCLLCANQDSLHASRRKANDSSSSNHPWLFFWNLICVIYRIVVVVSSKVDEKKERKGSRNTKCCNL